MRRLICCAFFMIFTPYPGGALIAQEPPKNSNGHGSLAVLSRSLEDIVNRVSPAVVQVFTTSYSPLAGSQAAGGGILEPQQGSGSGVIVDPQGYVITNAHVVFSARRVQIRLARARQGSSGSSILRPEGVMLSAEIVGMDKETDLAVIRIRREGLPFLSLGDSDALRPGQIVLAFGSPRGLENSVSMGVVSAVARQLRPEDPVIYIQTDAAINPGNSGGPLVTAEGKVVGINTFILSRSGGDEGIGFAIPSNIVGNVYRQIRTRGFVQRGVIGVHAQTITPTMADGLGLRQSRGVILGDVYPGGPADKAGLHVGDIVTALNGKTMENGRQFDVNVYGHPIGEEVELDVLRGGRKLNVRVEVADRPDDPTRFVDLVSPEKNLIKELGILCLDVDRRIAALLAPLRKDGRVVVAAISRESPFLEEGFEPGDVIYSINGTPVTSLVGLRAIVSIMKEGESLVFQIERDGRLRYLPLRL